MPVRAFSQPRLTPKYQGRAGGYFTAENAVGTSNWLTMSSMIWPSSSLLARRRSSRDRTGMRSISFRDRQAVPGDE